MEEELLSRNLPGVQVTRSKSHERTSELITDAEFILGDPIVVAPHLDRAENLRWFQATYAGVDAIFQHSQRRNYLLTRVTGVFGMNMAEYVLAHILNRERRLPRLAAQQQRREWRVERYRRLRDLTLGIMGLGTIGREIARLANGFGMVVWGLRRGASPVEGLDKTFSNGQLDEFLAGPDYIVSVLPGTPETTDLLSNGRLRACRPEAVLISIGRGDIINEDSLARALDEGWITGAVLDVFPQEPLPADSPLWHQQGLTITPHVAGLGSATDVVDLFVANLERYRAGQPLEHVVDWKRGY
ncbi:MAG: D-2-hydroxyacid dehydrogenase [Candidatus Neomarinimicrobiota bacterium]